MQNYSRRLKCLNLEWIYIQFCARAWSIDRRDLPPVQRSNVKRKKKKCRWWSEQGAIPRIVLARFGNERDAPSHSRSMFGKIPGHIWPPYVAPLRGPVTQEILVHDPVRPSFFYSNESGLFPYARISRRARIASIRSIKNCRDETLLLPSFSISTGLQRDNGNSNISRGPPLPKFIISSQRGFGFTFGIVFLKEEMDEAYMHPESLVILSIDKNCIQTGLLLPKIRGISTIYSD